ncbi:helix-turn-helix domain-containing protein [uncultured Roseibium sp.]|uniref:helix-turn-helix transcriptional regulator n=1 Tax=uncultured Roseibium sp. TaxID=1936171 RepID=UPI0032177A35
MTTKPDAASNLLTTHEAADYLRLAASTLNKMRLTGSGPDFLKLGPRRVVYDLKDLDRWLAARRRKSTSQYRYSDFKSSNSEDQQ